jgi:hypothetical protein
MYHKFHVIELMVLNILGEGSAKGRKAFVFGVLCVCVYRHQYIIYGAKSLWSKAFHHGSTQSQCRDYIYSKDTNCQT